MKQVVVAVFTSAFVAGTALAQPQILPTHAAPAKQSEHSFDDSTREKLTQRLGLTPDQKAKLQAFRKEHGNREQYFEQEKAAHTELRDMLEKDTATDEQILKRANELSKMMVEHNMERVQRMLAIRKILTPDQRVKFRDFIDERRKERGESGEHKAPGFGAQDREPLRERLHHRFDDAHDE